MDNRNGAFAAPELHVPAQGHGTLDGLSFAVKDVFAVAGHRSTAGNPYWQRSHPPAEKHAAAVSMLLRAGAALRGATHTDELMYSLGGEKFHYGTPENPRAESRIPGGSSSGSAVAVASGCVDFALGTDTGGSIRVPSAYCGVYGFRPTHGTVPMEGVIPLAPGFDTVGWIADRPEVLWQAGEVLLGSGSSGRRSHQQAVAQVYIPVECWALVGSGYAASLAEGLRRIQGSVERSAETELAPEGLAAWMDVFRELQGAEIWATHGPWIEREQPVFGPDIAARFAWAAALSGQDHSRALALRGDIAARLRLLLGEDGCLVLPTVPGPAPQRGGDLRQLEQNRSGAMKLSCIAGLAGLPQITLPVSGPGGLPLGLSVIGGYGQDQRLLSWISKVWPQ
ncbi:amidase [Paenibacillus albidus]|uniref:amidase n=1 Tax=Paenibacillus albidus TaxID=2041023 RepID=UPI002035FC96|nr:amidase [Paenibacillus albidus]